MMKQSTSFTQVATNLLNLLQGYSKTIRLLLVMFLTLTVSASAWGATYSKITTLSDLTTGDYVIVGYQKASSYGRLISGTLNSKRLAYTSHYTSAPSSYTTTEATEIWHLEVTGTGDTRNVTIYNDNKEQYLNPGFAWSNSSTSWTVSYNNGFSFKSGTEYLGVNKSANYWRSYASSTLTNVNGIILLKAAASCTTPPTVSSASNSNITSTTATVSCPSGITSLGSAGCSITSYGFVYGTSSNPTISNTKVQVGTTYTTTGTAFSKGLTGLTANTTYYVRPYATNGNGTAYGTQTSFKTLELPKYTVTLDAGSGTCAESVTEPNAGEGVTLPTPTLDGCDEWSFAGWKTTSAVTTETTTEPTLIPAGAYSPTSDITLYAVYKRTETSGDAFAGYEKVNEDLDDWSGKYLLSTGTYTATGSYSSNHLPRTTYTPSSEEKNEWEFTLTKVGNVGYSILFPDGSWYLGWKDGTDFVRSTEDPSENIKYLWTPSINGISNVSATTRKIADNGSADFRPYSSPSSGTVYLYKRVGGSSTTYYHSTPDCGSTEPTVCLIHENRSFYSLFF